MVFCHFYVLQRANNVRCNLAHQPPAWAFDKGALASQIRHFVTSQDIYMDPCIHFMLVTGRSKLQNDKQVVQL